MTVAFLDVDALMAHDDRDGHDAGDELACAAVDLGGSDAAARLRKVVDDLADASVHVTVGITQLEPDDTLHSVITRADRAMDDQRRG